MCGLGALCILLVIFFALPKIGMYKKAVTALWGAQHPALAYYLNRDDAGLAMRVGDYYFGGGAYDLGKAEHSYRLALELKPGILWGNYQLGRIYFVEGKLDSAIQEINAELVANPTNLRSLYVRALIEDAQRNLPAAEADFTRFIAWAPTEWAGYNDLSFVLAEEWKFSQAEQVIAQAMKQVPGAAGNPWLWNSLGLAQLNELHYTEAQASFAQAQKSAQAMTPEVWHHAYPGNDPAASSASIEAFKKAIAANLETAQKGNHI